MNLVLEDLQPKITFEMNAWLTRPYTRVEVENALKKCHLRKIQEWMGCLQFFINNIGKAVYGKD